MLPLSRAELLGPSDEPRRRYWIRVPSAAVVESLDAHPPLLAYLSDCWLSSVALAPHTIPWPGTDIFNASISQAMYFHGSARADEWLLFVIDSPFAGRGIGFCRGTLFDRTGRIIASVTQEALQVARR